MEQLEGKSIEEIVVGWFKKLKEWLKPNPADNALIQGLKMIYKAIAVLLLIALSPVILVVLLFVFFAAV